MRKNMTRAMLLVTVAAAAIAFSACGGKKAQETTAAETAAKEALAEVESTVEEAIAEVKEKSSELAGEGESKAEEKVSEAAEKVSEAAEAQTVTGTIESIKDFMFTIQTEDGKSYELSFEQGKAPEGLSAVKEGQKVTVSYTGELSEVDAFQGKVLSVRAAK